MRPSFEKLVPGSGESFRCFDRSSLRSPVKWHRHPEIELTYVAEGSGARLVGDHIGSYCNHDLVLLGSDLPHTWSSDEFRDRKYDRHSSIVTQFHPDFLGTGFFAAADMKDVSNLLDRALRGIWYPPERAEPIGHRITRMVNLTGALRIAELLTILHELAHLEESEMLSSESYFFDQSQVGETRIQTVCDHIARRFTDPDFNHHDLADLVHMNPSAFSRFFRQSTGRTLTSHISELRIGLACRLLTETDESILQISQEAGFSNLSNFNRRFRELRSTTPRAYRRKYQSVGAAEL